MNKLKCRKIIMRIALSGFLGISMLYHGNTSVQANSSGEQGNICKSGYHDFGDKYLRVNNKKKGSKPCFVENSFGNKQSMVTGAITAWNSRIAQYGNKSNISLANITDKNTAKIYIKKAYLGAKMGGLTHLFSGGKEIVPNPGLSQNYDSVTIQINSQILSNSDVSRVTGHELGHALGLSHRLNNRKSIMHNYYEDLETGVAAKIDIETLMHVYR